MGEKILLFIPMYNCEKQIIRVLDQIDEKISEYIAETIVVDNRSTDRSQEKVINYIKNNKNKNIKLFLNTENYNLGGSHKVAFNYAAKNNFDYVIVLHGDDQGNLSDFLPILKEEIYKKYDCCLGARFMKSSKLIGYSSIRIWGNYIFNWLFSLVTKEKVYDLGSGLNMYNIKIFKDKFYCLKYPDNLTFNCYMLLASDYYKQKINFFPISWREEDQVSNVKMISQAIQTLSLIIKYFFLREKYLNLEHRKKTIEIYDTKEITFENEKN